MGSRHANRYTTSSGIDKRLNVLQPRAVLYKAQGGTDVQAVGRLATATRARIACHYLLTLLLLELSKVRHEAGQIGIDAPFIQESLKLSLDTLIQRLELYERAKEGVSGWTAKAKTDSVSLVCLSEE